GRPAAPDHLRRGRAVPDLLQDQPDGGLGARLPDPALAALELPRARLRGELAAARRALRPLREHAPRGRNRLRLLARAAAGPPLPHALRRPAVPHPDPGARLLLLRDRSAAGGGTGLRAADLRARARADRDPL